MDTVLRSKAISGTMVRPKRTQRTVSSLALLGLLGGLGALGGCLRVPEDEINAPAERPAPSTGQEVLDRYIEAMGGEAQLRAVKQRSVEARIVLHPVEGCDPADPACTDTTQEGTFLLQTTSDGKMYRRMVIEAPKEEGAFAKARGLVSERGFDGEQGWEIQPSQPPILLLEAAAQKVVSREDAMLHWYLDWADRGVSPEIQSPRTIEVDGQEVELDGLAWKIPGTTMPPRTYWFDRATGLLREEVEQDSELSEARRTIIYSDYRDVDGLMVPFKIEQVAESGEQKQRIDLIVTKADHAEIPRPLFAIPELPPPDPMPDERRVALEEARAAAKDDPEDATAGIAWARAAWGAGAFEEAEEAVEATLKADSREPEALYLLGRVHAVRGDLRAARQAFEKAGKAGVNPQVIDYQLAILQLRERDAAAAAKYFARAGDTRQAERWEAAGPKLLSAKWGGDGCTATIPLIEGFIAPAIEVTLDGEPLHLLVDTSVSGVVIGQQKALSMLISTDAQSALGPQGPVVGHGVAEQLQLGDLSLGNVPVDMYPPELIADVAMGRDLDGVVGARIFEQTQLTVDPAAKTLTLISDGKRCSNKRAPQREGTAVPFYVHDDHMLFVKADMNDAEGMFLLNTAMRGAGLAATVGAFARAGTSSPIVRADEPGAFVDVEHVKMGGLDLGKTRGAWGWAEQEAPDQFRVDGMLGIETFGDRRWTLDFDQQTLYLGEATAETESKSESKSKSKSKSKPKSKPKSGE